mmetsp:Transcript_23691/g.54621  ORF Transcript_23691/g.54621 Transcript_23691/m.54621 type:complete len:241 (-) Transcript_23691:65-787(-)
MTEASFLSLSTRAVTSSTTIPAARVGGSFISTTSMRGERSTPSEAASMASIFFFLAFMMLGSLAYRGSFRRRSAVTTSGVPTWITSVPLSVSRSAVTPPSANVSSEAMVACGQPSMAASMGPVCAQSPSIDCLPSRTTSGASFSTISFSSFATASGWSSWSRRMSVVTWMPRSAPMARAVLICSCAFFGPTDTATISVAVFPSFMRIASSTAISQKGFIDIFTFASSTPFLSAAMRTLTA